MKQRIWGLLLFFAVVVSGAGFMFGKTIAQGVAQAVSLFYNGNYVSSSNPLPMNCTSGCSGGGSATIPPQTNTNSPQPLQTSLPVNAYNYVWNGTAWVSASSPAPAATNADGGINTHVTNTSLPNFATTQPVSMPTITPPSVASPAPANAIGAGLCDAAVLCLPAVGSKRFKCAVTTSLAQCVAAPSAGLSIHITSIQGLLLESATGGYLEVFEGTGTNCGTTSTLLMVFGSAGATATAINTGFGYGAGYGTVMELTAANELCVQVSGGTVSVAQVSGMIATYGDAGP